MRKKTTVHFEFSNLHCNTSFAEGLCLYQESHHNYGGRWTRPHQALTYLGSSELPVSDWLSLLGSLASEQMNFQDRWLHQTLVEGHQCWHLLRQASCLPQFLKLNDKKF